MRSDVLGSRLKNCEPIWGQRAGSLALPRRSSSRFSDESLLRQPWPTLWVGAVASLLILEFYHIFTTWGLHSMRKRGLQVYWPPRKTSRDLALLLSILLFITLGELHLRPISIFDTLQARHIPAFFVSLSSSVFNPLTLTLSSQSKPPLNHPDFFFVSRILSQIITDLNNR